MMIRVVVAAMAAGVASGFFPIVPSFPATTTQLRPTRLHATTTPDSLSFLTEAKTREIAERYGTPCYVYDAATLEARAREALAFPQRFGLTVRYAMKACPSGAILKLFDALGLHFDASSTHEAQRAMRAGIKPEKISLSTQQLDADFVDLVTQGVTVNACSLDQLRAYGDAFPGGEVGVRFNPGIGSGGTSKTNVGGPGSSFGIWHGLKEEVVAIAEAAGLTLTRVHTHIGSGSDPAVWSKTAKLSIDLCGFLGPSVTTLNLGGGYKVKRTASEKATDLQVIGQPVAEQLQTYADTTGTQLHLEVEPGTFLVANAGSLVSTVQDVVTTNTQSTEPGGRSFLKLDCGMTDILRPSLYGSQHPIVLVPSEASSSSLAEPHSYVVVGHCCESGDLLTPAPDEPDTIAERTTAVQAHAGDLAVIESAGAYCAAMSAKGYNSFPEPPEVILAKDGHTHLIKRRSDLDQLLQNEVSDFDSSTLLS